MKSEFQGQTYYFCCAGCKKKFDDNPALYVAGKPQPLARSSKSIPQPSNTPAPCIRKCARSARAHVRYAAWRLNL